MAKKDTPEAPETEKTVVRPNTENYQTARSASGSKSQHNGDPVAQALEGATLDETYGLAAEALETDVKALTEKYGHLNDGMQRMNLGNRLRGVVGKMNKAEDGSGDKYIVGISSGVREAVEKRAAEAEKAKAEKAAAAEAKGKEAAKTKGKSKAA